jgi:tight adherence protein B
MGAEPLLLALGAGSAATFAVLGLAQLMLIPRMRVQDRVTALQQQTAYAREVDLIRERRSPLQLFEGIVRSRSWTEQTHLMLERAGLPLQVGEYLALRIMSGVFLLLVGLAVARPFGMSPLLFGAGGLALGLLLPLLYVKRRIAARNRAIEPQLVELCELMASMMRSGFGYMQALTASMEQLGPPLSVELERMLDRVRLGAGIDEALEQLNKRLGSRDFDMMATAIAIQRRSGGSLADILTGVAETIRDRQLLQLEVLALTSRERMSAMIVAGFPVLLVAVLTTMLPDTFKLLFTDPIGRIILAIALVLDLCGYVVVKRITRIKA